MTDPIAAIDARTTVLVENRDDPEPAYYADPAWHGRRLRAAGPPPAEGMEPEDIPTEWALRAMARIEASGDIWTTLYDLGAILYADNISDGFHTMRAVVERMVNDGLVDACTCGCRADAVLTPMGVDAIRFGLAPATS